MILPKLCTSGKDKGQSSLTWPIARRHEQNIIAIRVRKHEQIKMCRSELMGAKTASSCSCSALLKLKHDPVARNIAYCFQSGCDE